MDLSGISEQYRKSVPLILATMTGGCGGIIGWIIVSSFQVLAAAVGFIIGFLSMLLFLSLLTLFFSSLSESINRQFNYVVGKIHETETELRSMINVRPLMRENLVPFGGWAADGRFAEMLVQLIWENRPGLVIECGSGTSTVLAARCLKQMGNGRILALEHDEKYVGFTRRHLCECELQDAVNVIHTPLRTWALNGGGMPWYDFDPASYLQQKIDLLIVDGPPGKTGPLARYPAVPLLHKWLSPNGIIILDDGNREDEREIAERWIEELNATYEFYSEGKGTWIIHNRRRENQLKTPSKS